MNILILTQKVDVNDDLLGAFPIWIEKFAQEFAKVNVVCLQKGEYSLPNNVTVRSLGKEQGQSRIKYLKRFYKYIWQLRKQYDAVFVHMNVEYVILGGLLWRLWGKRIALWYSHRKGSWLRVVALWLSHRVFSVSKGSFVNHKSKKFKALGHGVNTDLFKCSAEEKKQNQIQEIITIGRISPLKECQVLVEAAGQLVHKFKQDKFKVKFVGAPGDKFADYFADLKKRIQELKISDNIVFTGPIANNKILPHLCQADFFVSMQKIGDVGKSTIEAMSAEVPSLMCATGPSNHFSPEVSEYLFFDGSPESLAEKLHKCLQINPKKRAEYAKEQREIIKKYYNLSNLIHNIYLDYKNAKKD